MTPASLFVVTAGKKPSASVPATRVHVRPESEETYSPPVRMEARKTFPEWPESCTGVEGKPDAGLLPGVSRVA